MQIKELQIPVRDNKNLNATRYFVENKSKISKLGLVILCHGFTGDQTEWGRFPKTASEICDNGFDALTFDFAGSGKNPREPVLLSKQVQNLEDIFQWARSQKYSKVATIGLSFGGLTSLVAKSEIRKVAIFWAPAFYFKRIIPPFQVFFAKILGSLFPNKTIKRDSKNNEPILLNISFLKELLDIEVDPLLRNFNKPTLLIQGSADETVTPESSLEAFSQFPDDEEHKFIKVEGATHDFDGKHLDAFIHHSLDWLIKYLK